ncbi:MAG: hypothetical protein QXL94_09175 [Candidatus Parvarchaeum sp.]
MELSEMKRILKSIEDIKFTGESRYQQENRGITEQVILEFLKDRLDRLNFVEEQSDPHSKKFRLFFEKSNVYFLVIVCSISEDEKYLNVITEYISNKKRIKLNELWKKRHM